MLAKNIPTVINLDSTASSYSLASLVDSVKAIGLETIDSSVISDAYSVKRVIYKNDKFFIFDQKFFSIKVFDSKGLALTTELPDCHCTGAGFSKKPIEPKDSSIITLNYDAVQPGPFQSSAVITTNSIEPNTFLIFRGSIIQ